jgi:hypothetical protein
MVGEQQHPRHHLRDVLHHLHRPPRRAALAFRIRPDEAFVE